MTDRSSRATSADATGEREGGSRGTEGRSGMPESGTPASYGKRFVALFIDWILCLLLGGVLATATGLFATASLRGFWAYPILVLEYGLFVGLFGHTVGMRLARIRCVSVDGYGPIGVPRALLRGVLLCLLVPPLVIGAGGRGWHDRAAGSIVVHD